MRKAGDLINEYLREGRLAANRSQPIGAGSFGTVYQSDVPGNVIKQKHGYSPYDFAEEADLQSVAADMGIAPRVAGVETFAGGVGDRIEMADVRPNFEQHFNDYEMPVGRDGIRVSQQTGQLALKGIRLDDRNENNVFYNKMTGRPMQIDFGISSKVSGSDQVSALADATASGFANAGLRDVAEIYSATVYDLLAGGDVAEAMDVAKQGFSRLQKIKQPYL